MNHHDAVAVGHLLHLVGDAGRVELPAADGLGAEGRRGEASGHRAVGLDGEDLGRAEAAHPQARAVDHHVAQIAVQHHAPDRVAATRGEADQLAVGAGDVDEIGAGVVGGAPRRRADRAPFEDRAGDRVDGHQRAAAPERDVNPPRGVRDHPPGLVTGL